MNHCKVESVLNVYIIGYSLILTLISSSYFGFLSLLGFDDHVQHGGWSVQVMLIVTFLSIVFFSIKKFIIFTKIRMFAVFFVFVVFFFAFRDFYYVGDKVYLFKSYLSAFLYFVFAILLLEVSVEDRFKIFRMSLFVNLLIQVLFAVLFSDIAFHNDVEHFGRLKGSFSHKNALAAILLCQYFLYTLHFYLLRKSKIRKYSMLEVVLCTVIFSYLVLLSESMTILICLFLLIALFLVPSKLFSRTNIVLLSVILPLIIFFFTATLSYYIEYFGRDLTFTGRVVIWPVVMEAISEKPLLGYGYMWFWNGGIINNYTSLDWIIEFGNAHNVFLEIVLSYGVIGLFIVITIMSFKFTADDSYNKIYTIFLSLFVTYGLFESAFFYVNNFQLFLLFFVLVSNNRSLYGSKH